MTLSALRRALPAALLLLFAARAPGQGLATQLGAAATDALPIWTQPSLDAVADLSSIVRRFQESVFLVGTRYAGHGTAWVISQEHRLLATNAHVADIMFDSAGEMIAIANGEGPDQGLKIDEVYYHPGVRRHVGEDSIADMDPRQGDVDALSPDVAVLHVADGVDLPAAFALATPDETYELFAKPVAMIGFPGHDTRGVPTTEELAAATFRQGVVCRVTDFFNSVKVPRERLQFVQHSMPSWGGFSGSPI
ncbi:MAG: serine protease, partial [Planctomycetota bacterium]